jgi:hypothetical protein
VKVSSGSQDLKMLFDLHFHQIGGWEFGSCFQLFVTVGAQESSEFGQTLRHRLGIVFCLSGPALWPADFQKPTDVSGLSQILGRGQALGFAQHDYPTGGRKLAAMPLAEIESLLAVVLEGREVGPIQKPVPDFSQGEGNTSKCLSAILDSLFQPGKIHLLIVRQLSLIHPIILNHRRHCIGVFPVMVGSTYFIGKDSCQS